MGYGPAQVFHVLILLFLSVMLRYQAATTPTVLAPVFLLTAWVALFFCMKSAAFCLLFRLGDSVEEPAVEENRISGTSVTMLIYAAFVMILGLAVSVAYPDLKDAASGIAKGFDGMAFDHINMTQSITAAFTVYFVLLVFYEQRSGRRVRFESVLVLMTRHMIYVLPALVALILVYRGLSYLQSIARQSFVELITTMDFLPLGVVFFAYMMLFSVIRLACSVVLIGTALRYAVKSRGLIS